MNKNFETDDRPCDASAEKWTLFRCIRAIFIAIAGIVVIIVGLIVGAIPGPGGSIVVVAGIGILAIEFPWAKRLLRLIKVWLKKIWKWVWRKRDKRRTAIPNEPKTP